MPATHTNRLMRIGVAVRKIADRVFIRCDEHGFYNQ